MPPAALTEEPGERSVDRLRIRVADERVGQRCERSHYVGLRAVVESDDDLVNDRPKELQDRPDPRSRTARQAAHRERRSRVA